VLYHAYELTHAAVSPFRAAAQMGAHVLRNPANPLSQTIGFRATSAAFEMFVNATRRYGKPEFGLEAVEIAGGAAEIEEEVVYRKPFCDLLHFKRKSVLAEARHDPKVLILAPLSGHFATLLRGTVEQMLPEHDVYITDWIDARNVPVNQGRFDLDDYIDYIQEFCEFLARDGERPAVMGVCQPGVPALAATAVMSAHRAPHRPASLVLMGSPIDTRVSPTEPNVLATSRPLSWFEKNCIVTVPWPNPGFMRRVYPGFLQLSGFMSMNLDRHVDAHVKQFRNLVRGDGDGAAQHRTFYDEYLAVMDLTAEFYLQTVETVFQKHLLPQNKFVHRSERVDLHAITDVGLFTIEGEMDDITGRGQTEAALALCENLPDEKKAAYIQPKVGHYGVFNGSRFRQHIQPRIRDFIRARRAWVKG
jgi:poly(3-hydroxybutyrate) depolymerase